MHFLQGTVLVWNTAVLVDEGQSLSGRHEDLHAVPVAVGHAADKVFHRVWEVLVDTIHDELSGGMVEEILADKDLHGPDDAGSFSCDEEGVLVVREALVGDESSDGAHAGSDMVEEILVGNDPHWMDDAGSVSCDEEGVVAVVRELLVDTIHNVLSDGVHVRLEADIV